MVGILIRGVRILRYIPYAMVFLGVLMTGKVIQGDVAGPLIPKILIPLAVAGTGVALTFLLHPRRPR